MVLTEFGEDAVEDRDEYIAENIFWVLPGADWTTSLKAQTTPSTIRPSVDQMLAEIEHDDAALKDVLPRDAFALIDTPTAMADRL